MSFVWIVVIVAIAAAPLVSAFPTKAQRYEARIREYAMQSGLLVKLVPPPTVPARFRVCLDSHLMAYQLRRPKPEPSLIEGALAVKSDSKWVSVPLERDLADLMPALPCGVHIAELSEFTVTLFWDEKGGREAVDCVAHALRSFLQYKGFE